jgi:hypothetical protein
MTYNAETRQKHYFDVNKRLRLSMKIVPIGKRFRVIGSNSKPLFTAATKSDCQDWINFNYPVSDNQDNTFSNQNTCKEIKTMAQKIKMSDFLKAANINPKLASAVIRQFGGWETFQEKANDVANYGINGGYCGFIYYDDTVAFAKKHKKLIIENIMQFADDVGENFTKVIADFNCLKNSGIGDNDVLMCLMSPRSCDDYVLQQVYNALAWYVAETVAHEYVDFVYNLANEEF